MLLTLCAFFFENLFGIPGGLCLESCKESCDKSHAVFNVGKYCAKTGKYAPLNIIMKYNIFGPRILFEIIHSLTNPDNKEPEIMHIIVLDIVDSINKWFANSRNNQHVSVKIPTLEESTAFIVVWKSKMSF